MNDTALYSALREWRAHMLHPATVTALLATAAVMGVAGPFGTDARLPLVARLIYWLAVIAITYGLGALCDALLRGRLAGARIWVRIAVMALATGACISLAVLAINAVVFGWVPPVSALPGFLGATFAIAGIVTAGLTLMRRQIVTGAATAPANPVRILDRLPLDKRGPLVALSVEDHYVRVQTTRGEELVLMRLSDAVTEVGGTKGAQVHRSHWAAFDAVKLARRSGDRAILTMSNGTEIPVSRANIATIKEAGLLP